MRPTTLPTAPNRHHQIRHNTPCRPTFSGLWQPSFCKVFMLNLTKSASVRTRDVLHNVFYTFSKLARWRISSVASSEARRCRMQISRVAGFSGCAFLAVTSVVWDDVLIDLTTPYSTVALVRSLPLCLKWYNVSRVGVVHLSGMTSSPAHQV